jgi:halocyanin-like protein
MVEDSGVSRRGFLRAAAGGTAVAAAAGTASAQEGGGGGASPDYGGWLDDVGNYDGSTMDARGQSEVTISVGADGNGGAFAFDPPAVWVDTGTTVVWEWTGAGGGHNVHAMEGGDFTSETVPTEGFTYEQTFEESAIVNYQCDPHAQLGMKAAVAVGDDIPVNTPSTGGGGPTIPDSARTLGVASVIAMMSTLGLGYLFMKYGGDYETGD